MILMFSLVWTNLDSYGDSKPATIGFLFQTLPFIKIFFNFFLKIKNLEGFSKFMSIGTLNLHGNEFNWTELERIRHLHIIDFIASNNLKFGKDPNCKSIF